MFKNKKHIQYLVVSVIYFSVFSTTFSIGVVNNPNFNLIDFCMNLASELLGLIFSLVIVDTYIKMKRDYNQEKTRLRDLPLNKAEDITEKESVFEVVNNEGFGVVKNVSTLRDKQTGIQYLFVIHENGSGLTPLLDKNGKPIIDDRTT